MPPISPSLSDLLSEMFQVSSTSGSGVHRQLSSGLHVKAAQQGQRRMLILWRSESTPPSLTECEVTGTAAGFFHPVFKSWKTKECTVAYLVQEGFKGEVCQHAWGMQTHYDAKNESGYTASCQKCGATWRQATTGGGTKSPCTTTVKR